MHEKTSSESLHEEVSRIDCRNMSEIGGKRDGQMQMLPGYSLGIGATCWVSELFWKLGMEELWKRLQETCKRTEKVVREEIQ